MNDFMFEPRCPKCKDNGWIVDVDREYPCECRVSNADYYIERDIEDETYDM